MIDTVALGAFTLDKDLTQPITEAERLEAERLWWQSVEAERVDAENAERLRFLEAERLRGLKKKDTAPWGMIAGGAFLLWLLSALSKDK